MSEASHWATVKEAVELTGRSERTIRRWMKAGKLPVDRTGPGTRVDIAGLIPATPPQPEAMSGEMAELRQQNDALGAEVRRLRVDNDRLWAQLTETQDQVTKAQSVTLQVIERYDRLLAAPSQEQAPPQAQPAMPQATESDPSTVIEMEPPEPAPKLSRWDHIRAVFGR